MATCAADRAIVVAVSDPSSLRDAQRVVSQLGRIETAHLVVNRVRPRLLRRQGVTIDDAMDTAGLPLLGLVPEDANVILAASSGQPVAQFTQRGAAQAYGGTSPAACWGRRCRSCGSAKTTPKRTAGGTTANFLHPYFRVSPRPHPGGGGTVPNAKG